MTTKMNHNLSLSPVSISMTVEGSIDKLSRDTLDRMSHAMEHSECCDAIGECGKKCGLRAGHPGEIHENHYYGTITRFRLTRS